MRVLILSLLLFCGVAFCAAPPRSLDWVKASDHAVAGKTVRLQIKDLERTGKGFGTVTLSDGRNEEVVAHFVFFGPSKKQSFMFDMSPALRKHNFRKPNVWVEIDGKEYTLEPHQYEVTLVK